MSEKGYISFVFDYQNWGNSEGEPRFYESPEKKIVDIRSAVNFICGLKYTDIDNICVLGIGSGAGYCLCATPGIAIRKLILVAPILLDDKAKETVYGGESGIKSKYEHSRIAKEQFRKSGNIDYIDAASVNSSDTPIITGDNYYFDNGRGNVKEWSNKFATMSWEELLNFDPFKCNIKIDIPILFISSENCFFQENMKEFFKNIRSSLKRYYLKGTDDLDQSAYYDDPVYINEDVSVIDMWLKNHK